MEDTTNPDLFQPVRLGRYELTNRIVMAPLTRSRAGSDGVPHSFLMATYYEQRASAGLIVAEGTNISPQARGYAFTPGIYSQAQIEGWQPVTEGVHAKGGRIFVQLFDVALESWYGVSQQLCVFAPTCGGALVVEHNGDVYSCDHFVYPDNRLGNILSKTLGNLVNSPQQTRFGHAKEAGLPSDCHQCDVRFACNGECPKHRFLETGSGEPGLNYLCAGYKHFFHHIDPYMRFMANELRQDRAPARVMEWARARRHTAASLAVRQSRQSLSVR